jgi:c(7)-type cytochrome triheme protein
MKNSTSLSRVLTVLVLSGAVCQTAVSAETGSKEEANQFNRIMKKNTLRDNLLQGDGIHDPANKSLSLLQTPADAFDSLPKAKGGNGVNWVKAMDDGKIKPRLDIHDADAKPLVMDLNIVREVKGSMPNVVFPHKQHTELLDCSSCHPDIFIPQKGANQLSMSASLMGQQCGVCHGKVAYPMSRCSFCHSGKKQVVDAKKP